MREPKSSFIEHLCVWEWQGTGPTVLFAHATSFHARIWDSIIRRLPDDTHAIAIDLRGHGRSGNPTASEPTRWKNFSADIALVADTLGLRDIVGVGHSMGAHSIAYAAVLRPQLFRSILLIDPVIRPDAMYTGKWTESHFARNRRNVWTSGDEMYAKYANRPPFDKWDQAAVHDYCNYALNGTALACEPNFEASIYEASTEPDSRISPEDLATIQIPAIVMRSQYEAVPGVVDMNASATDPTLAERLPKGIDVKLDLGHFIPMEAPDLVAAQIRDLL
ncbi:alpha/beta hydrolase [Bryobacterales bacterium F-183]|nr:alpha/beta hydrolase [Bryobacterales bacterium F-183]